MTSTTYWDRGSVDVTEHFPTNPYEENNYRYTFKKYVFS